MTEQAPGSDQLRFGDALAELERIVAELESGTMPLEDSLARYERGVELLKALRETLGQAQQRITMLLGELETEDADDTGAE